MVSHDRHFLDRVTDHLLVFCGDGVVKDFVGSFSEYRAYVHDLDKDKRTAGKRAAPVLPDGESSAAAGFAPSNPVPAPAGSEDGRRAAGTPGRLPAAGKPDKPRKLTWKEQRELEAIEAELPQLEAEKAELEARLSSGTLPYTALQAVSERIQALIDEISQREERWLELSE